MLEDGQGRTDPDKVLKATFKWSLGGIAGMTHMEREWQVGRALSALEETDKGVPGFMSTGAAVVTKSGIFRGIATEQVLREPRQVVFNLAGLGRQRAVFIRTSLL